MKVEEKNSTLYLRILASRANLKESGPSGISRWLKDHACPTEPLGLLLRESYSNIAKSVKVQEVQNRHISLTEAKRHWKQQQVSQKGNKKYE